MDRIKKEELLKRYRSDECSEAEVEQLHTWYADWHKDDRVLVSETELERAEALMRGKLQDQIGFELLPASSQNNAPKNTRLWPRITILAAAVAAIVFGIWLFTNNGEKDIIDYAGDVAPGKNTATLTLPNGQTLELSDEKTGVVIDAKALTYNDGNSITDESGALNQIQGEVEIKTPRGGQYQVILPDSTKVWLNAASSIKFPSSFAKNKSRMVSVSGEVYFEVAKDQSRPFIVSSLNHQLKVLGTHFNFNGYTDNKEVKTTLLEGSVEVSAPNMISGRHYRLKPGQQSIVNNTIGNKIQVAHVNLNEVIAWKEGNFRFEDQTVTDIMKQIARWYDVEIVYQDNVSDIRLNASISRNRNVSQVLKMMEKTGEVHFEIEGRRIIVKR